jgi:branched-chain amino acid transport system permease protein
MLSDRYNQLFLLLVAASIVYCLTDPTAFFVQVILWATLAAVIGSCIRFVMLVCELNVGTAAFYGIGAYTSGCLFTLFGVPFAFTLVAAGLMGGLVAVVFGYVTMRTSGPYFMLISFAFAEIFRMLVVKADFLGGNNGIVGLFVPMAFESYYAATVVALSAIMIAVMAYLECSPLGKIFAAIKSREAVARSVGINVLAMRVLCLVISSVVAAMAGSLHAFTTHVITPNDFTFMLSVFALAYVKLGGEDHPIGPVLGAIILTLVAQYLISFGAYQQLFFGAVIAVAMLILPDGLIGRLMDFARAFRREGMSRAAE